MCGRETLLSYLLHLLAPITRVVTRDVWPCHDYLYLPTVTCTANDPASNNAVTIRSDVSPTDFNSIGPDANGATDSGRNIAELARFGG